MTIDAGLKPEGALERLHSAGAWRPSGVDGVTEAPFGPAQDGGGGVFVAWRTVGCRRPGSDLLQAKLTEWRDRRWRRGAGPRERGARRS